MSDEIGTGTKTLYGFKVREPDRRLTKNPEGRVVDIKRLWDRSHEIIGLNSLGYKGTEIAKLLGIDKSTVSNHLNSTLGRELVGERRAERDEEYEKLRDDVLELTRKGLEVYNKILESERDPLMPTSKLGKETADTVVLELSGLRAPTRIEGRHISAHLSAEELEEFKRRGIAAARAAGKIVEVSSESKAG